MGSTSVIAYHNQFTTKAPVIVLGRSGNIGNPRYYNFDCWAHNTCLYVKEFKSSPLWAYFLLKHINYDSFVGGSAVPTLNRNDVHALEIVIPPNDVQTDFSRKVNGAINEIQNNFLEIAILGEMQEILLSRMVGSL
jgi:type I restriction enzyme S subunit